MTQRILIVRLSAVGDTILSLPVLCALRKEYPNSRIGWVVGSGAADIVRGHDALDDLFVLTKNDLKSVKAYWAFLKRIREWQPTTLIDVQGLTKSALIGWYSGATRRIGLVKSEFEGRELSTWLNNTLVTPTSEHVVQRGLALLKPLGIENPEIEYRVPVSPAANQRVNEQVRELAGPNVELGPFAIINVGAGWVSKIWPAERYAAVAKHLKDRWNLRTMIAWGGSEERSLAEQVSILSGGAAIELPTTSLLELAEWIRRSVLFVGSDTGPMHLSVAIDIPTVSLIGPMPIGRVGHFSEKHIAIQRESLTEKERSRRKTDTRPMLSIQASDVIEACDELLTHRGFSAAPSIRNGAVPLPLATADQRNSSWEYSTK
ncbi:MAG: Lipopolysaccharide core heptosyltransferase RfaQ [Planctomycetota bacterium]